MIRYTRRHSLATILMVVYAIAFSAFGITFGAVNGIAMYRRSVRVSTLLGQNQADQIAASLSAAIVVELEAELSNRSRTAAMALGPTLLRDAPEPVQARAALQEYVTKNRFSATGYFYVLDPDGELIAHPQEAFVGSSVAEYGFVRTLISGPPTSIVYEWDEFGTGELHTKVAATALLPLEGWFLAASDHASTAIQRIAPTTLTRLLESVEGSTVLGAALIHQRPGRATLESPGFAAIKSRVTAFESWERRSTRFMRGPGGRWEYLAFARLPQFDATIAIVGQLTDFQGASRAYVSTLIVSLVFAMMLLWIVSVVVARRITEPMRAAIGRFIGSTADDEVARAGRSGNELITFLQDLARTRVRLQYESKRREAMQAHLLVTEAAFRSAHEAICILTPDGRVIRANPAFERIAGVTDFTTHHLTLRDLLSPRLHPGTFAAIERAATETGHGSGEVWRTDLQGAERAYFLSVSAVDDENGSLQNLVGVLQDVSQLKEARSRLEHVATHDELTGLPNRVVLSELADTALNDAERGLVRPAVIFMDIDEFKLVNDSFGHEAGDDLLRWISERIRDQLRGSDRLFRFGGDELVVLVRDSPDVDALVRMAERFLQAARSPVTIRATRYRPTVSIGVARYPESGRTAEELLKNADAAMYVSKRTRKNSFAFHDAEMTREATQRLSIQDDVARGLDQRQFSVSLQPILEVGSGRIAAAEALVRWTRAGENVPPGAFLPYIERSVVMTRLDRWVLEQACAFIARNQEHLPEGFVVTVNGTAADLADPAYARRFIETVDLAGVERSFLALEITESAAINDFETTSAGVRLLRDAGIRVYLDDFGEGYSSLRYLRDLGASGAKLDRSYMTHLVESSQARSFLRGFVELSRGLGLLSVIEGVETPEQLAVIENVGASYAQGFGIGLPVDIAMIERNLGGAGFPVFPGMAHDPLGVAADAPKP